MMTKSCPHCKSKHIVKAGTKVLVGRKRPRGQCMACGKTFYRDKGGTK